MINLVSLNPVELVGRHITSATYSAHCGMLTSPKQSKNVSEAIAHGAKWAADNDCFVEFNPRRILGWLERNRDIAQTCLWFNAPDVVRNAQATLFNFWIWQPIITAYGFKVAFTLQNGMEQGRIPWDYLAAVFIGGDTAFKYSAYVRETVKEANRRGVWVHQGRCNSIRRVIYSQSIGCDSYDGTGYKWGVNVVSHMPYLIHKQLALPEAA